jgi:hypothetical protein
MLAAAPEMPQPEIPVIETAISEAPVAEPPPAMPATPQVKLAADEESPEAPAGEVPAELLDPRLEFIVAMELVEPVSAQQILHSQRSTLVRINKPVHWIGFNERTREWQRLTHDSDIGVRRLRVGLQLVNRLGPVSEGHLHRRHAGAG